MSGREWIPNKGWDYVDDPVELEACRTAFLDWFDLTDLDMTLAWLGWQSSWRAAAQFHQKVAA